jgi:hypothetical protein
VTRIVASPMRDARRGSMMQPVQRTGGNMKKLIALFGLGLVLLLSSHAAAAKGCISGAAVGAVAGHVAGHHAILGAAAGCVINHHRNKVKDEREERAAAAQAAQPAPPVAAQAPQQR